MCRVEFSPTLSGRKGAHNFNILSLCDWNKLHAHFLLSQRQEK